MGKIYLISIFSTAVPNRYSFRLARARKALENSSNLLQDHATMMTTRIYNDETNDEHAQGLTTL